LKYNAKPVKITSGEKKIIDYLFILGATLLLAVDFAFSKLYQKKSQKHSGQL